jgi:hypothetical protein
MELLGEHFDYYRRRLCRHRLAVFVPAVSFAARSRPTTRSIAEATRSSAHRGCGADRGSLAVHSRFADQTGREPALSTVLCRSNGLSGSRLDISRVGDCRIDCLGCDDEVVSCRDLPHDAPRGTHGIPNYFRARGGFLRFDEPSERGRRHAIGVRHARLGEPVE